MAANMVVMANRPPPKTPKPKQHQAKPCHRNTKRMPPQAANIAASGGLNTSKLPFPMTMKQNNGERRVHQNAGNAA